MSTEQGPHKPDHHRAKLAAEISAAGIGAVIAAGAVGFGYRAWNRRRAELLNSDISLEEKAYRKQLEILSEPKLLPKDKYLLPRIAVRVYEATLGTMAGVTTRERLSEQLGVSRHDISRAMGYLRDNELVLHRRSNEEASGGGRPGFYASPALLWGIMEGDNEPLQQAMSELLGNLNDSSYNSEENPDPEL